MYDAAIETLENKRTDEYRTLHKTYGDVGNVYTTDAYNPDVYDSNFSYQTSQPSEIFSKTAVQSNSSIDVGEHKFVNGQAVVYHSGGVDIGGLVDGRTYYVVIADAEREFNAGAVNNGGDTITLAGHGLQDGDRVVYHKGDRFDIAIGGLLSEITYVVDVIDANTIQLRTVTDDALINLDSTLSTSDGHRLELVYPNIKLAATHADAVAATPVTLTLDGSTGSSSGHYFSDALHQGFGTGDITANSIEVGINLFKTGQAVVYHNGGGTDIGGLTDGATYYVVNVDATHIQLSASVPGRKEYHQWQG